MNRLLLLAIGIVIIGGGYLLLHHKGEPSTQHLPMEPIVGGWRSYTPGTGRFSVALPVLPQHATDTINDTTTQQLRHYEMYIADAGDGTIYMINMITYPADADLSNHKEVFKSFIDDMVTSNPQNHLLSSEPSHFHGHDAWDFNIQNSEGELRSKMFLDDKSRTLYVLSRLAKPNVPDHGEFDKFVDTFKLNTPSS